jgi:hypothetical protein
VFLVGTFLRIADRSGLVLYSGKYMNNVFRVVNKNLNALKVINMKHTHLLIVANQSLNCLFLHQTQQMCGLSSMFKVIHVLVTFQ